MLRYVLAQCWHNNVELNVCVPVSLLFTCYMFQSQRAAVVYAAVLQETVAPMLLRCMPLRVIDSS